MRKVVKIIGNEQTISLQVIQRDKNKCQRSSHFYLVYSELEDLVLKRHIVANDLSNFGVFSTDGNILKIYFYWLNLYGIDEIDGHIDNITINLRDLIDIQSGETKYVFDKSNKRMKSRLHFINDRNLKDVAANRILRKKFGKVISYLATSWEYDEDFYINNDYIDYSFYFEIMKLGKRKMNGGIIFHKDNEHPENLKLGHYSIHT